jgi:hypothetical protein
MNSLQQRRKVRLRGLRASASVRSTAFHVAGGINREARSRYVQANLFAGHNEGSLYRLPV